MNHYKVGMIMLLIAAVVVFIVFALVVSYVLKKDNARINWIEHEFCRRENERRTIQMTESKSE